MNDSYGFLSPVIYAVPAGVFIGYGILGKSAFLGTAIQAAGQQQSPLFS